jgi:glycosyltransferase involved in cell wall biosynthesis
MTDLSIVIPSRNEVFLKNTVEDILAHIEADTDIIVVLDGQWAEPELVQHPKVTIIHHPESIGQRAACNEAVEISTAKYVAKCDAHCAFDQGFDVKLLSDIHDDWTVAPTMRNLHVFDWVCPNGHRRYQGPSGPCKECGEPMVMDIVWIPKRSPQSNSYCFDNEPHFAYFGEWNKRPEGQGDITESMSLQGSFFMMLRQRYLDLNVCDESWGSWGSQGIEVACKSWLSGGKVMINHKTWYGHCFRTQGGDFGFPYHLSGRQVEHAKKMARDIFFNNKWPQQVHPLSWLVEKFWPVKGWTDEDLARIKNGH